MNYHWKQMFQSSFHHTNIVAYRTKKSRSLKSRRRWEQNSWSSKKSAISLFSGDITFNISLDLPAIFKSTSFLLLTQISSLHIFSISSYIFLIMNDILCLFKAPISESSAYQSQKSIFAYHCEVFWKYVYIWCRLTIYVKKWWG